MLIIIVRFRKKGDILLLDVNTAFIAYGRGEPDALSIAAQAGVQKQPIILTDKNVIPIPIG